MLWLPSGGGPFGPPYSKTRKDSRWGWRPPPIPAGRDEAGTIRLRSSLAPRPVFDLYRNVRIARIARNDQNAPDLL